MSERRAELLTALTVALLAAGVATFVAWRLLSVDTALFGGALDAVLACIIAGVIVWALLHHQIASRVFRGGSAPGGLVEERPARTLPLLQRAEHFLSRGPRWQTPITGASLLILLFVLYGIGLLSAPIAFAIMAALALSSLAFGTLLRDEEAEDRRADLPITMILTWAALYALKTGLLVVILMGLSWPAFIVFTALVLMRDYPWRWIAIALLVLVVFNLVVFFAFYRG